MTTFVVADIPGLIEGAHEGIGLGHEFLRHIERTLLLIHILDGAAQDPIADFESINHELEAYDLDLLSRPMIVAVNKMDQPSVSERWPELSAALKDRGYEVFAISALTRDGVAALMYRTAEVLAEQQRTLAEAEPQEALEVVTIKPPAAHFEVERKRKTFYVTARMLSAWRP